MTRRALVLVNRDARRGADQLEAALARLDALGLTLSEESTAHPERLSDIIRAQRGNVDLVIVGGGDGTIGAALAGLVDTGIPLAILPLGTANNTARALAIPTDLEAACDVVAAGEHRQVDVGQVNDRYFLTTASLGMSVDITGELDHGAKRRWGTLAYGLAAWRVLSRVRPFTAEIRWDGHNRVLSRTVQIVVGNGPHYGAALTVAEEATLEDGALDLYSIELRHWYRLLSLLPALKRGSQSTRAGVFTLRAGEIEIRTRRPASIDVDGELAATTPAVFRVLPRALCVYCPPRASSG